MLKKRKKQKVLKSYIIPRGSGLVSPAPAPLSTSEPTGRLRWDPPHTRRDHDHARTQTGFTLALNWDLLYSAARFGARGTLSANASGSLRLSGQKIEGVVQPGLKGHMRDPELGYGFQVSEKHFFRDMLARLA